MLLTYTRLVRNNGTFVCPSDTNLDHRKTDQQGDTSFIQASYNLHSGISSTQQMAAGGRPAAYNLQGIRVNPALQGKGAIIIMNGKKTVIR